MRIFYDCEFHERGADYPINLLSIGMVAENGAEYYAVVNTVHIDEAVNHEWLRNNVFPSLPLTVEPDTMYEGEYQWCWKTKHPDYQHVKPREQVREEVTAFVMRTGANPQLWAWFAAYDHVCLAQLFGRMIDFPAGFPMYTNDLKQEAVRLGNPRVPQQTSGNHNALADARHNLVIAQYLDSLERVRGLL